MKGLPRINTFLIKVSKVWQLLRRLHDKTAISPLSMVAIKEAYIAATLQD